MFTVDDVDGFYFIRNALDERQQWTFVRRCLLSYAQPPNVSNVDAITGQPQHDLFRRSLKSREAHALLQRLRWVTLGYQYDWTARKYHREHHVPFPPELFSESRRLASLVGVGDYRAEAAIVNFYHLDTQLCGHLDDVEERQDVPIVSMSFGHAAVFLLGGMSKEQEPIAVKIRSGDVGMTTNDNKRRR
jgi:alkylated DNA repair protein alkB family protein 1